MAVSTSETAIISEIAERPFGHFQRLTIVLKGLFKRTLQVIAPRNELTKKDNSLMNNEANPMSNSKNKTCCIIIF